VTFVVVCLYATFLLVERRAFETKLANLSDDTKRVARIREVIETINRRIGSYLALKTLLSVLLGAVSWVIMASFGLEFAGLWAVLTHS
jgi:predicted PurR-regulated permease PerM